MVNVKFSKETIWDGIIIMWEEKPARVDIFLATTLCG